jgi:hypothetical protein
MYQGKKEPMRGIIELRVGLRMKPCRRRDIALNVPRNEAGGVSQPAMKQSYPSIDVDLHSR